MVWFLRQVQHLDKGEVERRGGGEEGRRRRGEQRGGDWRFILKLDEMVEEFSIQRRFLTMNYLFSQIMLEGFRAITLQFLSHTCGIRTALPSSHSHTIQLFDSSNHPT